jgi:acetylxylan esterase
MASSSSNIVNMFKLVIALLATAAVAAPAKRQTPCADVHVFLSKGWNEPYPGRQGKLAGAICYGRESCDYEDILFSNTPEDDYCASVTEGNTNGVAQMTAYADRCPDSRLILTGYSQGANVAGDILGGGGGRFGNETVYCEVGQTAGLDPETSPGNKCEYPRSDDCAALTV